MGIIADVCAKQGHGLAELAAFSGMLESLLVAMDEQARNIPDEIMAALDNFCVAREIFLRKTIEGMEHACTTQKGDVVECVVLEYGNEEDYPHWEIVPMKVKNHFQAYAASHLPEGMKIRIVPFDGQAFRAWLKDAPDRQEARLLWAANVLPRQ